MNDTLLLDDTSADTSAGSAELDLDVRVQDVDRSRGLDTTGIFTSPNTYGVQSRCLTCC